MIECKVGHCTFFWFRYIQELHGGLDLSARQTRTQVAAWSFHPVLSLFFSLSPFSTETWGTALKVSGPGPSMTRIMMPSRTTAPVAIVTVALATFYKKKRATGFFWLTWEVLLTTTQVHVTGKAHLHPSRPGAPH